VHPTSTSTNTWLELVEDTVKIKQNIKEFNTIIQSKKTFTYAASGTQYEGTLVFEVFNGKSNQVSVEKVFIPFSTTTLFSDNVQNYPFRRVYMIISDDVIDDKKYETFKQQLIGNILGNQALLGNGSIDIEDIFDTYWLRIARPVFLEENNITKSFIENLEKNDLKDYLIYTPFDTVKQRNLTFTTVNTADEGQKKSQENMIKGLGNTTNQNTNVLRWNDPNGNAGALISKAKLN